MRSETKIETFIADSTTELSSNEFKSDQRLITPMANTTSPLYFHFITLSKSLWKRQIYLFPRYIVLLCDVASSFCVYTDLHGWLTSDFGRMGELANFELFSGGTMYKPGEVYFTEFRNKSQTIYCRAHLYCVATSKSNCRHRNGTYLLRVWCNFHVKPDTQ
jgi:hypothetical protein